MSDTLKRLLTGILTGTTVRFRSCDNSDQEAVERALPLVPMPLSERQRQAIRNAWSSDLSYIQGPPGTGKSHTIVALMLSALLLEKRILLVSHKRAAIDVVRGKLRQILGEELAIYVGADTEQRAVTRAKIQELISHTQSHGYRQRLGSAKTQEAAARDALVTTLRRADQAKRTLIQALDRANLSYQAQREHLKIREQYTSAFGCDDLTPENLERVPPVSPKWTQAVESLGDTQARRAEGAAVDGAELLRARIALSSYNRQFGASWIREQPWDVHRLHLHHRAVSAFDKARAESKHIDVDLNRLRISLEELTREAADQSKKYLRKLFSRIQLTQAAQCISDLSNFASLFRLRAPRLVKPRMAAIDYSALTRVFPLWLGEMRDLGAVLPFQPGIFELAVVDEASQVNIAEIVPAFFRADSFVVVGDRKQLGLEAAGLFALNRTFEELTWNNSFGGMAGVIDYNSARQRELTVSTSSILDFIVSPSNGLAIPWATLDEHFRSMPALARFTSEHFYREEGGLKVMTEVGENLGKDCFALIEVGGTRAIDGKYVPQEVDRAMELIAEIGTGRALGNGAPLRRLGFQDPQPYPSVGIISFTTMQRDVLRQRVEDLDEGIRKRLDLLVGTPEEFQGNERDVIIITFALGDNQRYAAGFYEQPKRFNVATSRARKFTYAVIGRCPKNASLLRRYFGSFGFSPTIGEAEVNQGAPQDEDVPLSSARLTWRLDERLCESEFERLLLECLREFIDRHSFSRLKLFNQVTTCGQKRLDFVLLDEDTNRTVAVEVDGPDHFCSDGISYHQAHLDRVAVLQRAKWRIVHVPFYKWYRNGWLYDRNDAEFENLLAQFHKELREALGIQATAPRRRMSLSN